jgi:triphosphatase
MRELELKFSLPLSLQDTLEREALDDADARRERVWSCYYDTPDGALARARMAVRVRRHGERWLQTVKADTGDRFERFEWERPIAGPTPERGALPPEDTPQGAIAHRSFGQWRALFETDFERCARRLEPMPGLTVELARDIGEIRCGDRREPIREVELECLTGTRAAFFEWALDWAGRMQACLLMPTKNERGLRLAARLPLAPSAVKAAAAAPAPGTPTGRAAAAILGACVTHACANIEPILAADSIEGPHQFRVALRRLRAALRFLDLRARDPAWEALDREASMLADAAGRVRDIDVFEAGLLRVLRGRFPADAALETLSRALDDARDDARMDLRRLLAGPAATQFVLRALGLSERLDDPDGEAALPGRDFAALAATRLRALNARVVRRTRGAQDEAAWHRTRIAVKNLRYALEFAVAALPRGTDPVRAGAVLARWQDRLGAGQDLAVARDVAADAMSRPGVPTEAAVRATALIDGWQALAAAPAAGRRRQASRALRAVHEALGPVATRGHRARAAPHAGAARPPDQSPDQPSDPATEPGAGPDASASDTGDPTAPDEAAPDRVR